jgi:drug/metabolite transporter (DMT)-like permease
MAKMDAYAVVFWRMILAGPILLLWGGLPRAVRIPWRSLLGGAFLLSAHFLLWVKAFDLTDYASNLVLLVSQPVMAAVLGHKLGEKHGRGIWVSVALATVGLVIVTGGDFRLGARAILGDVLCIIGGFCIAAYYVVSKPAREVLSTRVFMGLTFVLGAAMVAPVMLVTGSRIVDYPAPSWGWLAGLVLLTTLAGHGLMNRAAREVRLFTLNIVIVLEPAIGIALGALLFGATVSASALLGGVVLVVAVVVGLRS